MRRSGCTGPDVAVISYDRRSSFLEALGKPEFDGVWRVARPQDRPRRDRSQEALSSTSVASAYDTMAVKA